MTRHLDQQFVQLQIHRYNRYTDTDAKLKDKTGPKLCYKFVNNEFVIQSAKEYQLLKRQLSNITEIYSNLYWANGLRLCLFEVMYISNK